MAQPVKSAEPNGQVTDLLVADYEKNYKITRSRLIPSTTGRSHWPRRTGNKLSGSSMFHPAFNDLSRSTTV